ncbi:MAG: type II secretion system F family protein [Candidatus Omnitrophica bacterium]|nr:type II secretion system F family protein [Candidatus Omnitrophota bacterium]MDD5553741.1 type II secretion system F family protein [Candidatus Omnitrophota bacterium]
MNNYQYTAKDNTGRSVSGMLEGASEAEIADILHQKGLVVVSVQAVQKKASKPREKKVKLDDLVIFSRQLSTLIDSGVPLVQSLGILCEQIENKNLKDVIVSVRQDIEAGMSFFDALAKHPHIFSELFINMAKAGEASGTLNEVLDRLATYLEKSAALGRKVKSSLVYPAILVSMAVLITGALLLKVVPIFKEIFLSLGAKLPLPTRILIGISNLLGQYFLYFVGLTIIAGFAFQKYISTEKGRYNFDTQKLKVPVLGSLFHKVALAKFSRTFSTLVKSGVAILNALDIVGKTAGNKVIEGTLNDCRNAVRDGELLSRQLSKSRVFPPMVCRMISVGEQTGQLEKMLSKIADFYDEQVDAAVTALTSVIEPVVIAFLGVVIGGIVVSLFLPIFKITEYIAK